MIKYDYTVTVTGNTAKLDKDIYLFRGNKNVHYYFAIKNASFNFKGTTDLIEKTNAINAAVTVVKPNAVEVANAIAEVENGKIHLKVTEDLIDEEVEVGDFDLVFDLFDDTDGAVTIPKVTGQFHVLERPCATPISELAATNTTNEVDLAVADCAIATYAEPVASTNADGTFAKKTWVAKEKITTAELNRMEEGIAYNNSQYKDIVNELGRDSEGNPIDMGTIATNIRGAIKELKDNQGNSGDGSSYTLPIATSTKLGGVKPVNKTNEMTQEVGVDVEGKLYTKPTMNGTGSTTTEDIATAESTFSASVIDLQKISTGSYKGNHNTVMFVATANTTLSVGSDDLLGNFCSYMISTAVVAPMENFTEEDGIITLTRNPNYTGTVAFMNGRCGFTANLEKDKTYTFHVDNISCNFYLFAVENLPYSDNTLGPGDLLKSTIITGGSNITYTFTPSKNYKFLRIACNSLPATITRATLVEGSVAGEYGGSKQTYSLKTREIKYLKNIKNINCVGTGDFYVSPVAITEINDIKTEDGAIKTYATNKVYVNFGDSIWTFTTGEGSIGNLSDYMQKYCGGTWYNLATGGTTMAIRTGGAAGYDIFDFCNLADCVVSGDFSEQKAFTGATTNISNVDNVDWNKVDYITVSYGTNDLAFGGTIDNASNLYDKSTVCGALRYAIKTISSAYPKIKFKVLGIIYRHADGIDNSTIVEWNNKIKLACEYMGAEYIDIRSLCGINEGNYSSYSYDGTHLKGAGKDAYAKGFASTIINI
ncbi:SGNH/GDSL hydrolase family protein [Intestinibacter bartlettii]|uniref:GDSL-type esterase/lipase family protein n=1 Tax=Intestinibacter bartlettii TaxID=261299 RepID=UPI00403DE760